MLRIKHRHGRHERPEPQSREMPDTPPPPERFWRLIDWLEHKARGEWTDPRHEDMYAALQREYHRWLVESRIG